MSKSNRQQVDALLQTHRNARPLVDMVSAGSFRRFDSWMDNELARLVDRWQHLAAPRANRPSRRSLPTPPDHIV